MEQKYINITKPQFHSDIYTQIKRNSGIEEEFNLNDMLSYIPEENKKIFLFADIQNNRVFSYCTRKEGQEQSDKVTIYLFKNNSEFLDYLKSVYIKFKDNAEVWTDNLKDRIKEIKLLIESQKPNKIKELIKGEKKLKLNDVLSTCWGYDQTNVEMFRIVKFLGQNYFIIQEIGQEQIKGSSGFMCCDVKAGEEDLNKLPIKAFISNDGYMSICESGYKRSLSLDKGQRHYKSWYA